MRSPGMISVTLFFLVFPSFSMADNECFDGEEYIVKSSADFSDVKIVNDVNSSTLQRKPVDDKLCGFSMKPSDSICDGEVNVKFTAVSVSERNGSRCSVYSDQIICVCDYFACNSVKGVFYETMVSTLGTQKTTSIQHPRNKNPFDLVDRDSFLIECAMKIVEKAYGESVRAPITSPYDVAGYKAKYPNLFPNKTEVDEKKDVGQQHFPAPTTTTTTTTSTTTHPPAPADSKQGPPSPAATPTPGMSSGLVWGLVAGVAFLLAIVGGLVGFFCWRWRKERLREKREKQLKVLSFKLASEQEKHSFENFVYFNEECLKLPEPATYPYNEDTHAHPQVRCIESTRVKLGEEEDPEGRFFYHANGWELSDGTTLVAAQAPTDKTVKDFLRLLMVKEVDVVLCLMDIRGNLSPSCCFIAKKTGETQFAQFSIETLSIFETPLDPFKKERKLRITYKEKTHDVTFIEYTKWTYHGLPDSSRINRLLIEIDQMKPSTMMVMCKTGVTRTGTICALLEASSDLHQLIAVDFKKIFVRLWGCRWRMIQHSVQFRHIHAIFSDQLVMRQYLRRDGIYQKFSKSYSDFNTALDRRVKQLKMDPESSDWTGLIVYLKAQDGRGNKNYEVVE